MKKRLLLFVFTLLLAVGQAVAQTKISGVVLSATDNEPLPSARVQIVGTQQFVATDINGKFAMTTTVKGRTCRSYSRTPSY